MLATGSTVQALLISLIVGDPMRRFVAHCPRPKRTAQGRINIYRGGISLMRVVVSPRLLFLSLSVSLFFSIFLRFLGGR